jgi:hypothetical protein
VSLHFNYAEADFVRRAIGGFVLVIAVILMTGWRHTGRLASRIRRYRRSHSGALFYGGHGEAAVQRANNIIAVSALVPMVLVTIIYNGNITELTLIRVLLLIPIYMFGTCLGARCFKKAPAQIFRKAVLVLLIAIGISALAF